MTVYKLPKTKDNAEGTLSAGISAAGTSLVLQTGEGAEFPTVYRGTATSAGTSTTLNVTGIGATGVAVNDFIENITDGSCAFVTAVDTNSVTTTALRGGSNNTWQNSDTYAVGRFVITLNTRDTSGNITAQEKALVGNRSSDTLTVETGGRGFDGTTAASWLATDTYVSLFVTRDYQEELRKALATHVAEIDNVYTKEEVNAMGGRLPVRVATTTAGTLATSFENGDTVDGVTLATGDRILIKNQASATENGVYTVNASGAPTRATDSDSAANLNGEIISVLAGTVNANTVWMQITDNPAIGSDSIVWQRVAQTNSLVFSEASNATPTPNADLYLQHNVTALAAAAAFAAPTGTPADGQKLIVRIKDNGTARALTWNAIYRAVGITLPTTTVISKTLYLAMLYNSADTKWDVLAVNQ